MIRPDAGADIAQLIDRDNHCRQGQFDIDPVQQGAGDRTACLYESAHHPRRLCERVVGQERVLSRTVGRTAAVMRSHVSPTLVAMMSRYPYEIARRVVARSGSRPEPPRHHGQSREHDHRPVAERQQATAQDPLRGEGDIERGGHRQRQDPASVRQADEGYAESHPTHRRRLRSGDVVAQQAVQRTLKAGDTAVTCNPTSNRRTAAAAIGVHMRVDRADNRTRRKSSPMNTRRIPGDSKQKTS